MARWTLLLAALLVVPAPVVLADDPGTITPKLERRLADDPGPHDVIVLFDGPPAPAQRQLLERWGEGVSWYDVVPGAHATLPATRIQDLARLDGVRRIQPVEDLAFTLDTSKRTLRSAQAIEPLGYTGDGVGVAVVDSGIDPDHPGFGDRVVANVQIWSSGNVVPINRDTNGHGTHVAGIVGGDGAESPSGSYRGVAPDSRLVGVDVSRDFTTSTVLHAFDWILDHKDAYGIRVVTASWGRTDEPYDPEDPIVQASSELAENGIVVVFSTGNAGPAAGSISVEAQNPDVVAVGAVDDSTRIAPYSGRGPASNGNVKPDVVAPGDEITSTRSTASSEGLVGGLLGQRSETSSTEAYYTTLSGTSQASPHVAGLVALLLEADPSLTPGEVQALVEGSATDLGPDGPDPGYGYGLADAKSALHLLLGKEEPRNVLVDGGTETYAFRGRVTGTGEAAVQTFPAFSVHDDGVVRASFPVKPGASSIRVAFTWRPADAGFEVFLTHGGRSTGPYDGGEERDGQRVVTFTRSDDIEAGEWSIVARPDGSDLRYDATATVSYASASSSDSGTPTPDPDPGPAILLLAAVASAGAGIAYLWYRRRDGSAPS